MSITGRRGYAGRDPVAPLMQSILEGSHSSRAAGDASDMKYPGRGTKNKSMSTARFDEPESSKFGETDESFEPQFIFPSPHGSISDSTAEEETADPGSLLLIHDGTLLLDEMTDDRAAPPMRFCPADPPAGSRPYDPGALSSDQQRRLNHLKRGTARDDQRYLSQHPEIGAVCALLLSAILREQPLNIREFCSNWVKRTELPQEVDEFLTQYPPPMRHDDTAEEHDWFPEPPKEEEPTPKPVLTPAEEAMRRLERRRRRTKSLYDHRATLMQRELLREGAEDMIRRWLDDMLTTALSHRTEYWESFEKAQEYIADEGGVPTKARKVKSHRTKAQQEREAAELAEAEKAVEEALAAIRKKVEVMDTQKKAGVFLPVEAGKEEVVRPPDIEREEQDRAERVAEALQRLRTISRGGPSYMSALSEAITRLQETREGDLEKPPTVSERALRWSAIARGERVSVMAHKQDMDDKALRLAAAVASTERKKSIERPMSARGIEYDEDVEDEERMDKRRKKDKGRKKKMSAKDLEEYNLRLSLVFPELADMLHDDEDDARAVPEMPFQEQMAQATKEAIEIAMKRLSKRAKKQPGARGGAAVGIGRGARGVPGAPGVGAAEVADEMGIPLAEAVRLEERKRRKRLATAIVFEGLDPGQLKQMEREKESIPAWPTAGDYEGFQEESDTSLQESIDEEAKGKEEKPEEEGKAAEDAEEVVGGEATEGEGEEKREDEEVEEDEAVEAEAASPTGGEYQQVVATEEAAEVGPKKRATDLLREKLQEDAQKRTSGVVPEAPPILDEEENKFVGFEEPAKAEVKSEESKKSVGLRKSTIATQPLEPDPPTPGDQSDAD